MDSYIIAGIDEAGRGPLAGPVLAAAVVLDNEKPVVGLADSKLLSSKRRETLADKIKQSAITWAIGAASIEEIDDLNILQATLLAMRRAFDGLNCNVDHVLIDGLHCPSLPVLATSIVRGDQTMPAISAASILAKVARDHIMVELDQRYPQYGFAQHKGYPTKDHLHALLTHGPCQCHRLSFRPVRETIAYIT